MTMDLIFASNNPHKQIEAQEILGPGFHILTPASLGFAGDLPETHATLRANSKKPALSGTCSRPTALPTTRDWKSMRSAAHRACIPPAMPVEKRIRRPTGADCSRNSKAFLSKSGRHVSAAWCRSSREGSFTSSRGRARGTSPCRKAKASKVSAMIQFLFQKEWT